VSVVVPSIVKDCCASPSVSRYCRACEDLGVLYMCGHWCGLSDCRCKASGIVAICTRLGCGTSAGIVWQTGGRE
jgi:hypothetical protein